MLKAVLNKTEFEALDGTIQAFYSEKEGKYYLVVTGSEGYELANTVNLKASLQKERKRAEDAEKSLKTFDGITDPQAARDALGRIDEIASYDPEKKLTAAKEEFEKQMVAKYDSERKKLVSDHEAAIGVLTKKNGTYKSQLEGALISSSAQQALIAAGATEDGKMLLPHVESRVRMVESEDGKFEVEVIGDDKMARLTPKGGSTAKMTIPELVEEMKNEFPRGFKGTEASGGGASPGSGSGTVAGGRITLTKEESRNVATYRAAKAKAEKENKQLVISDT